MTIEILGTGCVKCKMLYEITQNAVNKAGIDAQIIKVEDPLAILSYGVMTTPALVVDAIVKTQGKIPSADEIVEFLR